MYELGCVKENEVKSLVSFLKNNGFVQVIYGVFYMEKNKSRIDVNITTENNNDSEVGDLNVYATLANGDEYMPYQGVNLKEFKEYFYNFNVAK